MGPTTKPTSTMKWRARERVSVWHCYICRRDLNRAGILFNDVPAAIRVFTGTAGYHSLTGGFSACDRHRNDAIGDAMKPLIDPSRNVSPLLSVTAYEVIADEDDDPALGRRLFIARQRFPDAAELAGAPRGRR